MAREARRCVRRQLSWHILRAGVKFPMRAASVDPKSTQLTPLTIGLDEVWFAYISLKERCSRSDGVEASGRVEAPQSTIFFVRERCVNCLFFDGLVTRKKIKTAVPETLGAPAVGACPETEKGLPS